MRSFHVEYANFIGIYTHGLYAISSDNLRALVNNFNAEKPHYIQLVNQLIHYITIILLVSDLQMV